MAGRNLNSVDGTIAERRLRSIYEWLDNGNNKKALNEAEKVLKKSPALQAARALKTLSLLRLGRGAEAMAVLEALVAENPCDDATLQAITICFRETNQLHRVCQMYENAVKADPTNEELHSHLFMSYVRIGDYKSQQKAAMALYKFAPKNPYYFWGVMSIVLQAKTTEEPAKKGILLSLAQKLVDNFIADNRMEAEQEARLYIMILEAQEKWTEVLKFMETPLYDTLVSGVTPQQTIPYLRKLGDWKKVNILCKELLIENQDRWDYYMPYFDSVFQLMKIDKGSAENDSDSVDDTAEKCHEFICQLVESVNSSRALRGPYLARLELFKRLSVDSDATQLLGSGVALCIEYLRAFAHKACAVPDLRPYLLMLPRSEREEHCQDFLTCLGFDENSEPETCDDIQRHVNCVILWRLCAPPPAAPVALQLAAGLHAQYSRCLRAGLVVSTATEFCAADTYAVLAAHHYFYAALEQKSSKPLLESVRLLELVLHHSPANFHVKLLLVQLYHLLGCASAADTLYSRLEVKHIQAVSLCWLHAARLPAAAAPQRAQALALDLRAFHHHHAKDSVEQLTYAYKFGTFEKLGEMGSWRARVASCGARTLLERDAGLATLLATPAPSPPPPPPPIPVYTSDNRDLDVIVSYRLDGPSRRGAELDAALAHLKDCLFTSIARATELSKNRTTEAGKIQKELLVSCIDKFASDMAKFKPLCQPQELCINIPFPSRLISFVNSPVPYRELYLNLFTMFAELSTDAAGARQPCRDVLALVERARREIQRSVDDRMGVEDPVWYMREMLEDLSNYLELIGIISYVLTLAADLITPPNTKKPKKKVAQTEDEIETSQLVEQINVSVRDSIQTLEEIFKNLPQYQFDTLDDLSKLNINLSYQCPVENRLKNGRNDMINDITNILKKKRKFLQNNYVVSNH